MVTSHSLFADKLKRHRLERGEHGRMTQDQLAEALGVSLDAVSKYERSLSFIRGDMEHRLAERLGWSRDEVQACREDWEGRRGGSTPGYRLLDQAVLDEVFDGSLEKFSDAAVNLFTGFLPDLPAEFAAYSGDWRAISATHPSCWAGVMAGNKLVAKWTVVPVLPHVEAEFRSGNLVEDEVKLESVRQLILPGTYYAYCPALVVSPGHERASPYLLSSFTSHLEDLVRRDILFHGIGTTSCSTGGAQICRDLGMVKLCDHRMWPEFGVWELTGAGIAQSIFARKSAVVREAYTRAFL